MRGRFRVLNAISGPHHAEVTTEVRLRPDLIFEADLRTSAHLFFLQYVPLSLAPMFDLMLRAGDVAIDVGANEGVYTCYAARLVGPTGRVVAIEPVPTTVERLQRNISRNHLGKIVEVRAEACGAEQGLVDIWVPNAGHHTSASAGRMDGSTPIEVPVTTLDEAADGRAVRLVKIDVEGFEAAVLAGATNLLRADEPPVVVLEVMDSHLRRVGHTTADVISSLAAAGYECYSLTRHGLQAGAPGNDPYAPNVVALHRTKHTAERQALRDVRWPMDQTC